MTWFRVDDTFHSHPKVLAAGNPAIGVWLRCGTWAASLLTDGHVPEHILRMYGTPTLAKTLVKVGLWHAEPEGYRFHDWSDYQPTREQIHAERAAAAERQRRGRERQKSQRDTTRESQRESRRDSRVTHTGSHGGPDPTRPEEPLRGDAADAPPPRDDLDDATPAQLAVAAFVAARAESELTTPTPSTRQRVGTTARTLATEGIPVDRLVHAAANLGHTPYDDLRRQVDLDTAKPTANGRRTLPAAGDVRAPTGPECQHGTPGAADDPGRCALCRTATSGQATADAGHG